MRVLEPRELEQRRLHRNKVQKVRKHKRRLLPLILAAIVIYGLLAMLIPSPDLQTHVNAITLPKAMAVSLPWPSYGQAAISAVGYGVLAENGDPKPFPIASVAKVITAIAVLKVRPMQPGTHGDMLTVTAQDVAIYNKYAADGQSVIKVELGEQITEYQALQALLLPSANNMADALVRWAFGSIENYITFVNPLTKTLGMMHTNIDDASGFSPKTTSIAADLAKLGVNAMNHPVIAEIVNQTQADLPVAGTVYNVNKQIGMKGVIGIKTGNTDEAGGCYLFSAKRKIDSTHEITVVGAVMGAPNLAKAMEDSLPLLDESFKNFKVITPLHVQDVVGRISQTYGANVPLVVGKSEAVAIWTAQPIRVEFAASPLKSQIIAGSYVGNLNLFVGEKNYHLPVVSGGAIRDLSPLWRLRHAGGYL